MQDQITLAPAGSASKPDISADVLAEWQRIVDLMAGIIEVPAGLIMRVHPPDSEIEVFVSSDTEGNPYERSERASLNTGLYCEKVIADRAMLLVPNALRNPEWDHNPDIDLGMISYLGFPLEWPDGEIFGTICVLDTEENPYTTVYQDLMRRFRAIVETHLKLQWEILEHEWAKKALQGHQRRLEAQNAELRKLTQAVEQSANTVVITDLEGCIEYVNPKFVETTGYTVEEAVGQNPRILKSGEQSDAYYEDLWQTITSGQEWRGEFHNKRKDGKLYWELASIAPIYDAQGQMTHFIAIKEDITERRRAEEALHQHTAELQTRNEELDAFAHTVAHDLKGPLSPIVGIAQVLDQRYVELSEEKLHDYLNKIARNGRKMGRIIDELLLLAGARKMEVDTEALDMASIVTEAQERLVDMIKEHQVEVILPKSWPAALGYAPWIEEVWANYLSNALKYGGRPGEDVPLRVEFGFDKLADQHIRFWVSDNGPGLTPEEQARLFIPFTRLNQVRAKGHGLGLSIVRRIVDKLGGQVGVESEVGAGSLFWFTLPAG